MATAHNRRYTQGAGPTWDHHLRDNARRYSEQNVLPIRNSGRSPERERRTDTDRENVIALTDEQREEIEEAFELFDTNKDNHIDLHELITALKALGFDQPKADVRALLDKHGVPAQRDRLSHQQQVKKRYFGSHRLLLPRSLFLHIAASMVSQRDPHDEIKRAYDLFDREGKGFVDQGDLRRIAHELGENIQDEELEGMIEEFDVRGTGSITKEDFIDICMSS